MLWLAIHLGRLPLEVFLRGRAPHADTQAPPPPFAVTTGLPHPRILLPDPAAVLSGLRPGMSLAAACALAPALVTATRDVALESAALTSLALWAEQFTPLLHVAEPDTLLLEIGGCLRLFDGLERLMAQVRHGLHELGFDASLACAPTATGASMLARNGLEERITDPPALRARLRHLPVDSLGEGDAATLAHMGLRTLGDCLRMPREGLARRFGAALLERLDRAFGHRPDPRAPFVPPPRFTSRLVLPAPVHDVEPLLFGIRRLVGELAGFLAGRQAGVVRFSLRLEHERGHATRVPIELSMPNREAAHLAMLAREHLSRLHLPAPVEACELACEETMQLAPRNFSLFADHESVTEERITLVERLRARLGREAVQGLALVPEHRPELAFREVDPGSIGGAGTGAERPLWLYQATRPVDVRTLRMLTGPERIESGWWDGRDARRDYFIALRDDGSRVWIYRLHDDAEPVSRWYLQGLFA